MEEQRVAAVEELRRLGDRQIECEQEIESQESQVSVQRAALEEMEQSLNRARQGVSDIKTRISNHENRIIFNEERGEEFRGLVERYRADVAGAEEKFRIAETQLSDTDAELAQITTMLAGELRVMEEKQAAVAALTGQRQETERMISTAANDSARIESRVSGLRGQVATRRPNSTAPSPIWNSAPCSLPTPTRRFARRKAVSPGWIANSATPSARWRKKSRSSKCCATSMKVAKAFPKARRLCSAVSTTRIFSSRQSSARSRSSSTSRRSS
jgi:hypothetical protein